MMVHDGKKRRSGKSLEGMMVHDGKKRRSGKSLEGMMDDIS